jgi:hypothetical protein
MAVSAGKTGREQAGSERAPPGADPHDGSMARAERYVFNKDLINH